MTPLRDAVALSGDTIPVYMPFGDKAIEKFADLPRATPAEVKLSEQQEAGRKRLFGFNHGMTYEQACALNRREFEDELQDAEAEADIAALVWRHDDDDAHAPRD